MDWQKGRTSGVEDRRGGGPSGPQMAGGGVVALLLALAGYYFFGIDPNAVMSAVNAVQGGPVAESSPASVTTPEDELGKFSDVIHTSANDTWEAVFQRSGRQYRRSNMVIYTQQTRTGCGTGQAALGPFYCPEDEKVYLDLDFFNTLQSQLGAKGDFAAAYVIGHEVGHHVQKVLGISEQVHTKQQTLSQREGNALSVKLELQADCYAGVWAKVSNNDMQWLDQGDLEEAINAAAAVGDDTLQKASTGRVVPDAFTHGSSEQRMRWFRAGYEAASPKACDTFNS
jgi:hypothetical protein